MKWGIIMSPSKQIIIGIFIVIAAVILSGVLRCQADNWTPQEVHKEILWQLLNVGDIITSDNIARNPESLHENGLPRVFFGQHPSRTKMAGVLIGWGALHWVLSDTIARDWVLFGNKYHPKAFFQDVTIGITGTATVINCTFY
jgi:hypothetical protein